MASLTVPKGDLWVNLSPYEPDRIVPEALGQTEMGRDLLAQDYLLKQLTASLMNPEGETGKKFWEKIYSAVGATDIPVDAFNKVWIIPDQVEVYQNGDVAYIVKAKLKVMLEEDYLGNGERGMVDKNDPSTTHQSPTTDIKSIIRSTIIPIIEDEVNTGESFANLRQIFHSMILAKWYEQHFKNSVLGQSYVDKNVTEGIALSDVIPERFSRESILKSGSPTEAFGDDSFVKNVSNQTIEDIYNQYVAAYKSGAADVIKEEYDPITQGIVTRKYFVGGVKFDLAQLQVVKGLERADSQDMVRLSIQLIPRLLNLRNMFIILGFISALMMASVMSKAQSGGGIYELIIQDIHQKAWFDIPGQLSQIIGKNLITGIGGNHFSPLPQKYFISGLRDYVSQNPQQKIVVGLETESSHDEEMSDYIHTPLSVNVETLGVLLPGGVEILNALRFLVSRGADIHVFGFDDRDRNPFTGFRQDTLMAKIVDERIHLFPDAKFLILAGQRHIQKSPRLVRDAYSPSMFYLLQQTHGAGGVYAAAVYDGFTDTQGFYDGNSFEDPQNFFLEAVLADPELKEEGFIISTSSLVFETIRIDSPFSLNRRKPFDWTGAQLIATGTLAQELDGVMYGFSSRAMLSKPLMIAGFLVLMWLALLKPSRLDAQIDTLPRVDSIQWDSVMRDMSSQLDPQVFKESQGYRGNKKALELLDYLTALPQDRQRIVWEVLDFDEFLGSVSFVHPMLTYNTPEYVYKSIIGFVAMWPHDVNILKEILPQVREHFVYAYTMTNIFKVIHVSEASTVIEYLKRLDVLSLDHQPDSEDQTSGPYAIRVNEWEHFFGALYLLTEFTRNQVIPKEYSESILLKLMKANTDEDYGRWINADLVPAIRREFHRRRYLSYRQTKKMSSLEILELAVAGFRSKNQVPHEEINRVHSFLLTQDLDLNDWGDVFMGLVYAKNVRFFSPQYISKVDPNLVRNYLWYGDPFANLWTGATTQFPSTYSGSDDRTQRVIGMPLAISGELSHLYSFIINADSSGVFDWEANSHNFEIDHYLGWNLMNRPSFIPFFEEVMDDAYLHAEHAKEFLRMRQNLQDPLLMPIWDLILTQEQKKLLLHPSQTDGLLNSLSDSQLYYIGRMLIARDIFRGQYFQKIRRLDHRIQRLINSEQWQWTLDHTAGVMTMNIYKPDDFRDMGHGYGNEILPAYDQETAGHPLGRRISVDFNIHLIVLLRQNNISLSANTFSHLQSKAFEYAVRNFKGDGYGWKQPVQVIQSINIEQINGWLNELKKEGIIFKDKAMLFNNKGGIDLNSLNMQTSGEANTIQVPIDPAMLNQPIQMLVPKIIHIGDVNVMDFLGLNADTPVPPTDHADQTADIPKLSFYRKNSFNSYIENLT